MTVRVGCPPTASACRQKREFGTSRWGGSKVRLHRRRRRAEGGMSACETKLSIANVGPTAVFRGERTRFARFGSRMDADLRSKHPRSPAFARSRLDSAADVPVRSDRLIYICARKPRAAGLSEFRHMHEPAVSPRIKARAPQVAVGAARTSGVVSMTTHIR